MVAGTLRCAVRQRRMCTRLNSADSTRNVTASIDEAQQTFEPDEKQRRASSRLESLRKSKLTDLLACNFVMANREARKRSSCIISQLAREKATLNAKKAMLRSPVSGCPA